MLSFLLASWTLFAATMPVPGARELTRAFEERYRGARALKSDFIETYSEGGRLSRSEAGVAYFRKPGKMRWEYQSAEKNVFLVDGKWAWFYVPADHSATRVSAKRSSDWRTPLALLAGEAKLSRICARVELADNEPPQSKGNGVLRCVLKGAEPSGPAGKQSAAASEVDRQDVFLEIQPQTGELARVIVREKAGVAVEFQFAGWQFDPPIAEQLFHFAPPPGVAIVDGETLATPAGER